MRAPTLPLLLTVLGASCGSPIAPGGTTHLTCPAPFARVAVLGASLASGFRNGGSEEQDLPLGAVLDSMILMPHESPLDLGSAMFFLDPEGKGEHQVQEALAWEPSLVVALDFLFWYLYGDGFADEEARLASLEAGLRELEPFSCPLVIGDLPDMSAAIGSMLSREQVPAPATLRAASERIREWAQARSRRRPTLFFSLVARSIEPHEGPTPGGEDWLQIDHLHPTLGALIVLAEEVLQSLKAELGPFPPDTLATDPELAWELLRG